MKIVVLGFGHLAHIVAACLEQHGHEVRQHDLEPRLLREGHADPQLEPDYRRRYFGGENPIALEEAELVWACYDTPLDAQGRGQDDLVAVRLIEQLALFSRSVLIVNSSPWRVGTTRRLEQQFPDRHFVYIVENIRVGRAMADFLHQSNIIVGWRPTLRARSDNLLHGLLKEFTHRVLYMSPESAEMSKHALNGFLALNIAYANEVADLCSVTGADAADVMRAVSSDDRVSPQAPLKPGAPFGGGSLMRDVLTLEQLAQTTLLPNSWVAGPIIRAIRLSNERHMPVPS